MLQTRFILRLERLESWQRYLYGLLVRAHVCRTRHVLQAGGIRRRTRSYHRRILDLGKPDD